MADFGWSGSSGGRSVPNAWLRPLLVIAAAVLAVGAFAICVFGPGAAWLPTLPVEDRRSEAARTERSNGVVTADSVRVGVTRTLRVQVVDKSPSPPLEEPVVRLRGASQQSIPATEVREASRNGELWIGTIPSTWTVVHVEAVAADGRVGSTDCVVEHAQDIVVVTIGAVERDYLAHVRDLFGNPVPGATVMWRSQGARWSELGLTDHRGRLVVRKPPETTLVAAGEGFTSIGVVVLRERSDVFLWTQTCREVEGTVRDERGSPVAGADVAIRGANGKQLPIASQQWDGDGLVTVSALDGTFHLQLPAAHGTVGCIAHSETAGVGSCVIEPGIGPCRVEVRCENGWSWHVSAEDSHGKPIVALTVIVTELGDGYTGRRRSVRAPDGVISLDGLVVGTVSLVVLFEGGWRRVLSRTGATGDRVRDVVRPVEGSAVAGTVWCADGSPAHGATVMLFGTSVMTTESDVAGHFMFHGCESGNVELMAVHDRARVSKNVVVGDEGIAMTLPAPARPGALRLRTNGPEPEAVVTVRCNPAGTSGSQPHCITGGQGVISPLPEGSYCVRVEAAGYGSVEVSADVVAGAMTEIVATLGRLGSIELEQPLLEVGTVKITPVGGAPEQAYFGVVQGARLEGLRPGDYVVSVEFVHGGAWSEQVAVVAGGASRCMVARRPTVAVTLVPPAGDRVDLAWGTRDNQNWQSLLRCRPGYSPVLALPPGDYWVIALRNGLPLGRQFFRVDGAGGTLTIRVQS